MSEPEAKRERLRETAQLGEQLMRDKVTPALAPEDRGKFVALDVESGDYRSGRRRDHRLGAAQVAPARRADLARPGRVRDGLPDSGGRVTGTVDEFLVPRATVRLRGPTGIVRDVDAMIDTGFIGLLAVPEEFVIEMKLEFHSTTKLRLADMVAREYEVYEVDAGIPPPTAFEGV